MTEKLFYKDAYIREFDAVIVDAGMKEGVFAVALDQTAFYPEGGGQRADNGIMELTDSLSFSVTDVQETDGCIWHYISGPVTKDTGIRCDAPEGTDAGGQSEKTGGLIKVGDRVRCRIDWNRRFDHMQQHSGEHIVSGMICSTFHCNNVGFHMGEDMVTVDFDKRISYEQALLIEARANRYIWEDHPVVETWPSKEELVSIDYRSKKEIEGDVRLIAFPGADRCACCGTHVSGSAQVGLVKFISAKNFHEGTRLELLCGKRAADYLAGIYIQAKAAAVMLSTSEENLSEHVGKLQAENIRLKMDGQTVMSRLLEIQAEMCQDKGNVLVISEKISGVQARELADMTANVCGGTAAVFALTEGRYQYAVINKKGLPDQMIKDMNAALDGRGGGRNGFAQGSVAASEAQIRTFFHDYYCSDF